MFIFSEISPLNIHFSPQGHDDTNCGTIHEKCQSIEYGFNKAMENNVTIVLETSTIESLVYNLSKSLKSNNESVHLRIEKENKKGLNPTISGNQYQLIQLKRAFHIELDSVDLKEISFVNEHNVTSKSSLSIKNSSIFTKLSPLIYLDRVSSDISIEIENCVLRSSTNQKWLHIRGGSISNIRISNTVLEGGKVYADNIKSLQLKAVSVQNFQNDNEDKLKSPAVLNLSNIKNLLIENCTIHNNTISNLIQLRETENFNFHREAVINNCIFQSNTIHRLINIINHKNVKFKRIMLKDNQFYGNVMTFTKTNGFIEKFSIVDTKSDRKLLHAYESNLNMTNLKITKFYPSYEVIVAGYSNVTAKNVYLSDVQIKQYGSLLVCEQESIMKISNVVLNQSTFSGCFIEVRRNSSFHSNDITIYNANFEGMFSYALSADYVIFQRIKIYASLFNSDLFLAAVKDFFIGNIEITS